MKKNKKVNPLHVNGTLNDLKAFLALINTRKQRFADGAEAPLPKTYAVNETAKLMHPGEMKLKVSEAEKLSDDIITYTLVSADGSPLAPFRAGEYITVKLSIGSARLTRAYSLCSSPAEARDGKYQITVKRVPDGFASGYILDTWAPGTELSAYSPEGNFVYEPLRDAKTVIGIAGGSGITPFLSLAKAINDAEEDAKLILLYGSRTKKDILFEKELKQLSKNENIQVIHVLSEQKLKSYESGFITAELIKKYAPEGEYSIFVCGPRSMYAFTEKELNKLKLEKKYIRYELAPAVTDASLLPGFPKKSAGKEYTVKLNISGKESTLPCKTTESILTALERAGVDAPARCRSGECGFCRAKLAKGEVFIPGESDYRRMADVQFGYIHPCCTYPLGDIEVVI